MKSDIAQSAMEVTDSLTISAMLQLFYAEHQTTKEHALTVTQVTSFTKVHALLYPSWQIFILTTLLAVLKNWLY